MNLNVCTEEPVNYLNSELHTKVASKVKTPLAGGETLQRWQAVYLDAQSIDVLQPDIGLCGGFTETKKVYDMAEVGDVKIQAHVCGGPVATAASLHLEAAIPNFLIHEHHIYAIKPWNRELCLQDHQPQTDVLRYQSSRISIELNDRL